MLFPHSYQFTLRQQNRHHTFLPPSFKSSATQIAFSKGRSPLSISRYEFNRVEGFHHDGRRKNIVVSVSSPKEDIPLADNSTTAKDEHKGETSVTTNNTDRNELLYPLPPLRNNGTIQLDSIHTLYYEEYGLNQSGASANEPTATDTPNNVGKTALSLHGGPGAGSFPNHARFFNPDLYPRIILFDQRGCGRSTPRGETRSNTLHHLVADIERLRVHLGVETWDVVLGGSWGSTLAMAYAQMFPGRVGSIVLRGVCTLRTEEVDWLFAMNSSRFREEDNQKNDLKHIGQLNQSRWEQFQDAVIPKRSGDSHEQFNRKVLHRYYDCLLGKNETQRMHAASAWFRWEMGVSSLSMPDWDEGEETDMGARLLVWKPSSEWLFEDRNNDHNGKSIQHNLKASEAAFMLRRWSQPDNSLINEDIVHKSPISSASACRIVQDVDWPPSLACDTSSRFPKGFLPVQAMLTCFYSVNNEFMMSDFKLLSRSRIEKICHIPCIAIQGGHDLICPPDTALDLHEVWPEMELRIVRNGKHSMYDPYIAAEIVKATDQMGTL